MRDLPAFTNRLAKNARHWGKWAQRRQLAAYRVYERDLPQFPLAIDRYGDWAHVQEFDTGWQQSPAEHEAWMATVVAQVASILAVPPQQVIYKQRRRQKGLAQYEKQEATGQTFVVAEAGLQFLVNLTQYLDTGLFLDHRNTRARVRDLAAGKTMLNLFAYTGAFTVYAAAGGARATLTVDLSNTYQDWTRQNMQLNGFTGEQHAYVRADVLAWLPEAIRAGRCFDLIVCDPPSFSNSARMSDVLDVQRDHVALVSQCMRLLNPGGTLFFSTNLRTFELDPALAAQYRCDNLSAQSVPEDFRDKKIHQCYRWQHR
jgi:23S rRNA (cytosine1962-C5)-methyltransferase